MDTIVAAFYKFTPIEDISTKQQDLRQVCEYLKIKGTILLAKEGINGTIAGTREAIDRIFDRLRAYPCFQDLQYKESHTDRIPFKRLKVRLKKEIVTIGIPEVDPNSQVGTYVEPKDWNELVADPDVVVIDTRNEYEVKIGSFQGAIDPQIDSFGEFPEYVKNRLDRHKQTKIAMFCTGGIRCEKASSYLLSQGFQQVYHLKGGILKYLEEIPAQESLWQGECFVFDDRVAVTHGLDRGSYRMCYSCGNPVPEGELVSCPRCEGEKESIDRNN
jgi:UPF0176 protein